MKPLFPLAFLLVLAASVPAQSYQVQHYGRNINTKGNETGAIVIGDTLLLYSSMQQTTQSSGFYDYTVERMCVFQAPISPDGTIGEGKECTWGINTPNQHNGNVAFDPVNNDLYFTRCNMSEKDDYRCEIFVTHREKGTWQKPRKVGGEVNKQGFTSTHPTIENLDGNKVILYFSSDRPGGNGGLDIWYVVINGKKVESCINLGAPVNSPSDEITPFYDNKHNCLYFSSNCKCEGGSGEYDVYRSEGSRNTWSRRTNLGPTLNSPYNDIYFTVWDSPTPKGFLASNRKDSYFATDTGCCNDIYQWSLGFENKELSVENRETKETTKSQVSNLKSQVSDEPPSYLMHDNSESIKLYFHNDEPDPKSKSPHTTLTYFQTYNRYMFQRQQYVQQLGRIADSAIRDSAQRVIDEFFDYEVKRNCDRFEDFIDQMAEQLMSGYTVSLTVTGYASPSNTPEYNRALSQRRIETIVNQFREWRKGALKLYIDAGRLQISEIPFGSSQASEMSKIRTKRSQVGAIYSVEAARERRIEIIDYEISTEY